MLLDREIIICRCVLATNSALAWRCVQLHVLQLSAAWDESFAVGRWYQRGRLGAVSRQLHHVCVVFT
jgi:hypothetical protein